MYDVVPTWSNLSLVTMFQNRRLSLSTFWQTIYSTTYLKEIQFIGFLNVLQKIMFGMHGFKWFGRTYISQTT